MQTSSAAKVVFRIFLTFLLAAAILPTPARAQTFTVLHTFKGPDGANPAAPVILDKAGNIYGTTEAGGTGTCSSMGCGTAFVLNKSGKEIALHSFNGNDGFSPGAGLLRDSKGDLFGTTTGGGDDTSACGGVEGDGCGVAFRLSPNGKEVRYNFQGTPDGFQPEASLVEDSAGNLYGTASYGGEHGLGAVFKINTATDKESVLYSFTGGSDGCFPFGVVLDSTGNVYGVTLDGGSGFGNSGLGVVFKVDPAGNETVLHTFGGDDGANPVSVLVFDLAGNLYGTSQNGGSSDQCGFSGCGAVFEVSPAQGGGWSERVLYSFCSLAGCVDGEKPLYGPLVVDASGNLYGTALDGGESDHGVVFELTDGVESVLHSFTGGPDGAYPQAGLAMDDLGNLYGAAQSGGSSCYTRYTCGTVFKITP
jgi:uncharacterized repeat protein (TIGR03803 family)